MAKGVKSNGGFRMLAPKLATSWDPSIKGMSAKPATPSFRTVTLGQITSNRGVEGNGTMTTGAFAKAHGSFTVADNTFGFPIELIIGDYRLVNTIDYVVGAAAADTATNLAAAISTLPGFSATAALAVVTVLCDYPADDTDFRAIQHGDTVTLGSFTGGGFLTKGTPNAGPPVLA